MIARLCLKSNMDRFIDEHGQLKKIHIERLKSNMDRFIEKRKQKNKLLMFV